MATIIYTRMEQYLLDHISNLDKIPVTQLEQLALDVVDDKNYETVGIIVLESRSQITDNTVYELKVDKSFTGDRTMVWLDTYTTSCL